MILLPHYVQLLFIVVGLFAGNSVVDSANVTLCDSGNEKVQVTESEFDSEIKELQWVGDDRKLFAVTASGRLYRSMDGGKSWNDIVDKLEGLEISVDSRFAFGTGVSSVWATSNPELTLVLGHEKRVWTINDITNNYAYQDFEGVVSHITPHPSKPDALVQTSSDRCFNRTAPGACRSALWHYSLTTPTQVTLITHDVVQFEWSDEGRILVSTWDKSMDDPNFTLHTYARDPSLIALYRHDPFAAPPRFDIVLPHCAGFLTTENALYVATRESGTSLTLWRATRLGADPPRKLGFPTTLQQTRFTICNAEEGSLFVNVQHGDSKWGNLYVSSANGTAGVDYQFVLSLERAARELNGQVQFAKFYGMPGVFLSNVREDSGLAGRLESILTVITWDNGGDWHALAAPSANDEGSRQFACRGIACHLHLHGVRKQRLHRDRFQRVEFGPLHTKANTVGLVMATGNVGLALSDSDVGVFLSRDAGSSWLALASGSHTYDFADHGALILMARNDEPTSVLGYTWNQGLNWTSCQFTSKPLVEIDNIEADPEAASEVLLMFGLDQATGRGYLAHVDFSSLHERACDETDYEFWRPAVGGLRCQLGVERTFKRRRRDAACYNKDVVESKPTEVICQCSRDDYACDSCFTPRMSSDLSTTHCVIDQACMRHRQTDEGAAERRLEAPMSGVGPNGDLPPPDCAPGRHYYVSRGYTLVGNTRCNTAGGVDLFPLSLPCPAAAPDSGGVGGGVVVLLVLLVLIGVAVLAALAFVWWRRRSAPPSLQYGTLQDSDNDDDDDDYEQTHGVESADSDFTSNN